MPPPYPVSYVFRTSASDALQPIVILNDAVDRRKIEPVLVESFKGGDQDMTMQLQHAKDNDAQAIVMYCLAPEGAMLVKSAEKLKLRLPIIGPWGMSQQ